jgi:hypothetical protein
MVSYEWVSETKDEHGDITDISFYDSIWDIPKEDFGVNDIGLVRDKGGNANGLEVRLWAYIKDNDIPRHFSDAMQEVTTVKIPNRYLDEFYRFIKGKICYELMIQMLSSYVKIRQLRRMPMPTIEPINNDGKH